MTAPRGRSTLAMVVAAVLTQGRSAPAEPPPAAPAPAATGPNEHDAATRLIDRAVEELAALTPGALETSAYFGVLSLDERRRVAEAADRMLALLDEASRRADESVRRLEEGLMGVPASGTPPAEAARRAEQVEAALARLVDVEQARRLPYYRAVARTLRAASAEAAAGADPAGAALELLGPQSPDGSGGHRLLRAAALLNTGAADDRALDAIEAELAWFDSPEGEHADPRVRELAELGRHVLASARGDRTALPASTTTAIAEATARGLVIRARREPAQRAHHLAAACRELLEAPWPEVAGEPDRLRAYAKVAAILEPGADTAAVPAEAAFGRAVTLLRHNPESLEARALLEQIDRRRDVPERLRAHALWELTAAATRDTGPQAEGRALELLERFIRDYPSDARAPAAARSLEALAARAAAAPDASPARRAELTRTRLLALQALIADPSAQAPDRSQWRLRWLLLSVAATDPAVVSAEQLGPIVAAAQKIDQAHAGASLAALGELFARALASPAWPTRPPGERLALIQAMRSVRGVRTDPTLPILAAEAAIQAARSEVAADELRPLLGGPLDQPGQPARPRLRLAMARALASTPEQRTRALAVLRELTGDLDRATSSTPRPLDYWQAWALALELLQADNADGARSEAIRTQAKRLELLDPAMGGPETADRIRRVRQAADPG